MASKTYSEPRLTPALVERYEGDVVDGQYHGCGAACFFNGDQYEVRAGIAKPPRFVVVGDGEESWVVL